MANMKTRRHARYSPPEGTVAALKPYGEEFGLIKNIGEGGLAFERLIFNPREENVPTEPKKRIDVETFEKCSILVKLKEGENFNHRNILNISRIEI
ncbi:MAG: hypothetical protein ABIL06_06545 [Pseudomonadota bacterium]